MILVDSSIWIGHLRHADDDLKRLLEARLVFCHPFVIGELALGHLRERAVIISFLQNLPQAIRVEDEEVLSFVEQHKLAGLGIGYVDVHLLASARLTSLLLWTQDKGLHGAASKLGLAYKQN